MIKVPSMVGMEYGIKPVIMGIGDIEFSNLLREADFVGVAYQVPMHFLDIRDLELGLIFGNPEGGRQAFGRFLDWIKGSGGDANALSLEFIEHKDGNYTICISQGIEQLIGRCIPLPLNEWVTPVFSVISHYKKINIISGMYYKFKEAASCRKVHIKALSCKEGAYPYRISDEEIIKEKILFYDEDDIPAGSVAQGFKKGINKKKSTLPNAAPEEIIAHRMKVIKNFFPITYEKVTTQRYLGDLFKEFQDDFSHSQILQAICNIELYRKLEKQHKLDILERESVHLDLLHYLVENQEMFGDPLSEDSMKKDMVANQIALDLRTREELSRRDG